MSNNKYSFKATTLELANGNIKGEIRLGTDGNLLFNGISLKINDIEGDGPIKYNSETKTLESTNSLDFDGVKLDKTGLTVGSVTLDEDDITNIKGLLNTGGAFVVFESVIDNQDDKLLYYNTTNKNCYYKQKLLLKDIYNNSLIVPGILTLDGATLVSNNILDMKSLTENYNRNIKSLDINNIRLVNQLDDIKFGDGVNKTIVSSQYVTTGIVTSSFLNTNIVDAKEITMGTTHILPENIVTPNITLLNQEEDITFDGTTVISKEEIITKDLTVTGAFNIGNMIITDFYTTNMESETVLNNGTITTNNLVGSDIQTTNLTVTNPITQLQVNNITNTNATITNATITNGTIPYVDSIITTTETLNSKNINNTNKITTAILESDSIIGTTTVFDLSTITDLKTTSIVNTGLLTTTDGKIDNLNVTTIDGVDATFTQMIVNDLESINASIDSLTIKTLEGVTNQITNNKEIIINSPLSFGDSKLEEEDVSELNRLANSAKNSSAYTQFVLKDSNGNYINNTITLSTEVPSYIFGLDSLGNFIKTNSIDDPDNKISFLETDTMTEDARILISDNNLYKSILLTDLTETINTEELNISSAVKFTSTGIEYDSSSITYNKLFSAVTSGDEIITNTNPMNINDYLITMSGADKYKTKLINTPAVNRILSADASGNIQCGFETDKIRLDDNLLLKTLNAGILYTDPVTGLSSKQNITVGTTVYGDNTIAVNGTNLGLSDMIALNNKYNNSTIAQLSNDTYLDSNYNKVYLYKVDQDRTNNRSFVYHDDTFHLTNKLMVPGEFGVGTTTANTTILDTGLVVKNINGSTIVGFDSITSPGINIPYSLVNSLLNYTADNIPYNNVYDNIIVKDNGMFRSMPMFNFTIPRTKSGFMYYNNGNIVSDEITVIKDNYKMDLSTGGIAFNNGSKASGITADIITCTDINTAEQLSTNISSVINIINGILGTTVTTEFINKYLTKDSSGNIKLAKLLTDRDSSNTTRDKFVYYDSDDGLTMSSQIQVDGINGNNVYISTDEINVSKTDDSVTYKTQFNNNSLSIIKMNGEIISTKVTINNSGVISYTDGIGNNYNISIGDIHKFVKYGISETYQNNEKFMYVDGNGNTTLTPLYYDNVGDIDSFVYYQMGTGLVKNTNLTLANTLKMTPNSLVYSDNIIELEDGDDSTNSDNTIVINKTGVTINNTILSKDMLSLVSANDSTTYDRDGITFLKEGMSDTILFSDLLKFVNIDSTLNNLSGGDNILVIDGPSIVRKSLLNIGTGTAANNKFTSYDGTSLYSNTSMNYNGLTLSAATNNKFISIDTTMKLSDVLSFNNGSTQYENMRIKVNTNYIDLSKLSGLSNGLLTQVVPTKNTKIITSDMEYVNLFTESGTVSSDTNTHMIVYKDGVGMVKTDTEDLTYNGSMTFLDTNNRLALYPSGITADGITVTNGNLTKLSELSLTAPSSTNPVVYYKYNNKIRERNLFETNIADTGNYFVYNKNGLLDRGKTMTVDNLSIGSNGMNIVGAGSTTGITSTISSGSLSYTNTVNNTTTSYGPGSISYTKDGITTTIAIEQIVGIEGTTPEITLPSFIKSDRIEYEDGSSIYPIGSTEAKYIKDLSSAVTIGNSIVSSKPLTINTATLTDTNILKLQEISGLTSSNVSYISTLNSILGLGGSLLELPYSANNSMLVINQSTLINGLPRLSTVKLPTYLKENDISILSTNKLSIGTNDLTNVGLSKILDLLSGFTKTSDGYSYSNTLTLSALEDTTDGSPLLVLADGKIKKKTIEVPKMVNGELYLKKNTSEAILNYDGVVALNNIVTRQPLALGKLYMNNDITFGTTIMNQTGIIFGNNSIGYQALLNTMTKVDNINVVYDTIVYNPANTGYLTTTSGGYKFQPLYKAGPDNIKHVLDTESTSKYTTATKFLTTQNGISSGNMLTNMVLQSVGGGMLELNSTNLATTNTTATGNKQMVIKPNIVKFNDITATQYTNSSSELMQDTMITGTTFEYDKLTVEKSGETKWLASGQGVPAPITSYDIVSCKYANMISAGNAFASTNYSQFAESNLIMCGDYTKRKLLADNASYVPDVMDSSKDLRLMGIYGSGASSLFYDTANKMISSGMFRTLYIGENLEVQKSASVKYTLPVLKLYSSSKRETTNYSIMAKAKSYVEFALANRNISPSDGKIIDSNPFTHISDIISFYYTEGGKNTYVTGLVTLTKGDEIKRTCNVTVSLQFDESMTLDVIYNTMYLFYIDTNVAGGLSYGSSVIEQVVGLVKADVYISPRYKDMTGGVYRYFGYLRIPRNDTSTRDILYTNFYGPDVIDSFLGFSFYTVGSTTFTRKSTSNTSKTTGTLGSTAETSTPVYPFAKYAKFLIPITIETPSS
jgi:hypothetical protein